MKSLQTKVPRTFASKQAPSSGTTHSEIVYYKNTCIHMDHTLQCASLLYTIMLVTIKEVLPCRKLTQY